MPVTATPRFGLDRLDANQVQADVTHNLAITKLDFLGGGPIAVKNQTTATPPGSPVEGDAYLVAAGGTGAWSGKDKFVAVFIGSGWYFLLNYGLQIWDLSNGQLKIYNNSATWALIGTY